MKMLPKLKKAGSVFLAALLLVFSLSVPALALPSIDESRSGSVTINMSGTASSGIKFTLYKVAALTGNPSYTLTPDFVNSGLQLEQLSTAPTHTVEANAKMLESYVSKNNISGTTLSTDVNGSVQFSRLSLGYYLFVPDNDPTSPASICDPFLCPVPMQSTDGSSWIYEITAYTKCESPAGAVILQKVNPSKLPLSGAVFRLEKKNYYTGSISVPAGTQTGSDNVGTYFWSAWISALTTNSSGQIAVKGLPVKQDYRFVEVTPPSGYVLDSTPHEFKVESAGSVTLVNGSYVRSSDSVPIVTVVNYYPPSSSSPPPHHSSSSSSWPPDSSPSSTPTSSLPDNSIPKSPPTESIPDENVPKSGFDLPKTGGSIAYGLCTYGGIFVAAFGAVTFILSRKKKT